MTRESAPQADEVILKQIIENHFTFTGSMRARRLLEDWSNCRRLFVKVFPDEYRRALEDLYRAHEESVKSA